jgi:hypothetical protein
MYSWRWVSEMALDSICFGWSTFWHCWFHLYIVRASPMTSWSSAAPVLFLVLWLSTARSKSGKPCAKISSFLSFLVLDQFVKGGKSLFTKAWLNCCKLLRIVPTIKFVPHGSLACKRACGGGVDFVLFCDGLLACAKAAGMSLLRVGFETRSWLIT